MKKITGYELSRRWFDFCFENPEKISPNHTAIYFFAIEHCNRLGWKSKFGFPTQMTMDAIGIKKHQTYIRYFNDLIEWSFFDLIQKSTNQYSANIISLKSAMPKTGKALDKAIITHTAKQTQSNGQSNSSVSKPLTNKPTTINQKSLYVDFLQKFNQITNRKFRVLDDKTKRQLNARIKEGFTIEEILTAAKNCKNDEYHIQNPKYLTPEFITRTDKLQKYLHETGTERRFDEKFRTTEERERFIGGRVKEIRY